MASSSPQQAESKTEPPNAWFRNQTEALSNSVQFGSRTITNTRAEHLKGFKASSALLAALYLLSSRDSAKEESHKPRTTAMHAVDQRLRRWQSRPKAWQNLLHKICRRSTPLYLVASFSIYSTATPWPGCMAWTPTQTPRVRKGSISYRLARVSQCNTAGDGG